MRTDYYSTDYSGALYTLMCAGTAIVRSSRNKQEKEGEEVDCYIKERAYVEGLRDACTAAFMTEGQIEESRCMYFNLMKLTAEDKNYKLMEIQEYYLMGLDNGVNMANRMMLKDYNKYVSHRKQLIELYREMHRLK